MYADGELVNSSARSFKEAFIQTFCLYFIFNIQYPKDISQLLEFVQRYFFVYYTETSRGRKKNLTSMAKVMRLLCKINEFSKK